jgi:hypothetical protein
MLLSKQCNCLINGQCYAIEATEKKEIAGYAKLKKTKTNLEISN